MRKLSEIGEQKMLCDSSPDTPHELRNRPVIIMAPSERWALVHTAIEKWEQSYCGKYKVETEYSDSPNTVQRSRPVTIQDFLKDEGL